LNWKKATLIRPDWNQLKVQEEDGRTETFLMEKAAPFRVLHWQSSEGEQAELVNTTRMKSWR
jgi:hypothetical protein